MKKRFFTLCIALIGSIVIFESCKKPDIPTEISVPEYTYASLDTNGGNWKPLLLTSNNQIAVTAPDSVSSTAYKSDLAATKSAAASLSSDQRNAITYWGSNPLIRWEEIAQELTAKYNLPPQPDATPDANGNYYGVPSAANPTAYPLFPFAHPCYSVRMSAYWSGAEYDAMIATWHYKYLYNRPAPYKVDNAVATSLPQNGIPSYPSEYAAIAGVSQVILTAMFPLDSAYIAAKAQELENVSIWSGMNVQSDVAAGDALGRAVAGMYMARSKTDGMKNAQPARLNGPHVQDSIDAAAQTNFGWHWNNLETPRRPVGIAPLYGKVKAWYFADITSIRPPAPPAPGSAAFNSAVQELQGYVDNMTTAQRTSALEWNDGGGSYTPPEHWNRIAFTDITANQLNPLRTARVFAYLNTAMMDAGISCWDSKYYYDYPRPTDAAGVKTDIGIPNFPSYPSGHSSFSWAAATVLSYLFPGDAGSFTSKANDAANSRVYSRIHYRFDADGGQQIGQAVGNAAVAVAQGDGAN
jgi:hypothetical protein